MLRNGSSHCQTASLFIGSATKAVGYQEVGFSTVLLEAAHLAPRWNPLLAELHQRELQRGHRNRATLAVARKLVAFLMAADRGHLARAAPMLR